MTWNDQGPCAVWLNKKQSTSGAHSDILFRARMWGGGLGPAGGVADGRQDQELQGYEGYRGTLPISLWVLGGDAEALSRSSSYTSILGDMCLWVGVP